MLQDCYRLGYKAVDKARYDCQSLVIVFMYSYSCNAIKLQYSANLVVHAS